MYDFVRGSLFRKTPTEAVVEAGGVGHLLEVSLMTSDRLPAVGEPVMLFTHFKIQDDRVRLFGFVSLEDRSLFRHLVSVAGIGPSHGLALLSGHPAPDVWDFIRNEDWRALAKTKGIGPKIAQRVCTELKDRAARVSLTPFSDHGASRAAADPGLEDAIAALLVLGYSESQAHKAVQAARKNVADPSNVQELIREALQSS